MPSYTEPHNFFNEDLFQGTSIIDLLQNSPDVNLPCYMSDEEPLALPLMLPSSSDLSLTGSVNVLDMINQDVMLGSVQSTSNAATEVTYVTQGTAPTAAPFTAGDVFLPSASVSTSDTFVKPFRSYFSVDRTSQPTLTLSPRTNTNSITTQSTNPFVVNPFDATQNQLVRNPFAATSNTDYEVDRGSPKIPSRSSRKSKSKSKSSRKSSKVVKKISRTSSKQSIVVISSSQKGNLLTRSDVKATVTHTVTRTTDVVVECTQTVAATTDTETHTVPAIANNTGGPCTVAGVVSTTTVSQNVSCTAVDTTATVAVTSSDFLASYTFAKARAPSTVVAPMQSAFVPRKVLYSTPVISRVPSVSAADRVCDQFTKLPGQGTCASGGCGRVVPGQAPRPRARLVIPMPLNTFATSVASGVTTTATVANRHHSSQAVRPLQCSHSLHTTVAHTTPATTASTVAPRTLTHSSFAFPPGATLYAAKKIKSNSQTLTTEPQTFAIVDSKGTYTTLTISPDFTTTTASPLVMTQTQTTTTGTASTAGSTTSPGPSDSGAKSRSRFLIANLTNSQMNTNTGIGYLVTSPIGTDIISRSSPTAQATRSTVPAATTIASHTITTISSEALNRLRSRLMCNVPSTAAGLSLPPPSTMSLDGNKARGPVTIIANQLISGVTPRERVPNAEASGVTPRTILSTASQGLYTASTPVTTNVPSRSPTVPATRSFNRVVIPINLHANAMSHSPVPTQGTYFITGVNRSLSTAGDPATRSSHVVIPIIHKTSATAAPNPTLTVSPAGTVVPTPVGSIDPHSTIRNRLTIQVSTIESIIPGTTTPITAYTIARTRPPQSVYSLPGSSYMSSTKASDGTRNPATMTLLTFAPSTSATAGCPQKPPTIPRGDMTALTTAIPTLTSTGNRYVIKLAGGGAMGSGTTSTVTSSITAPITTAAIIQEHHFTEPHPVAVGTRFRAVPAPRTYSIAQRSPQPPITRHINPRFKKVITSPSPLQIFADVVCPPSTTPTTATQSLPRTRFTLSHTPGSSTLVVPQYKNTVFKNLATVARPERMSARLMGPRAPTERFVLNRSVALLTPRRTTIFSPTQSQREFRTQRVEPTLSMSQASPAVFDTDQLPVADESLPSNKEDDK